MSPVRTLADLRPGEQAVVERLRRNFGARLRLLEMGLTSGTRISLVRRGVFGGPLDIRVRGYQLSLRAEEARQVVLQSGAAASETKERIGA